MHPPDLILRAHTKLLNANSAMKDCVFQEQKKRVKHVIRIFIKGSWVLNVFDATRRKHGGLPIWFNVINKQDFHCLGLMLWRHANRVTHELPNSNISEHRQHVSDVMPLIIKALRIQTILLQASHRIVFNVIKSRRRGGEAVSITHSQRSH